MILCVFPAKAGIPAYRQAGSHHKTPEFPENEQNFMKSPCVYILASKRNGTLYIGVTSDLRSRVWQHKNKVVPGFTEKYDANILVYYEQGEGILGAIQREKQLKKWNRSWKIRLIEEKNPKWKDLYDEL